MPDPDTTTLRSRIAHCADDETTISGVAIAAGDVTRGMSGDLKLWTAEALRAAAPTLDGTDLNALHTEQTVSGPVRAAWDTDREAIVYEVDVDDPKLAEQAANGDLAVSIEARHGTDGTAETPRGEAMVASDIRFTGLAVDRAGAAPSNTIDTGPAASAALSQTAALAASLSADEIDAALADDMTRVAGVAFTDTATGELDESALDADEHDLGDHYLYGEGEDKEDFSYPVVDADGVLRRGNVDAAWQLGCRGQCDDATAHRRRLMELAGEFDEPPEWAMGEDATASDEAAESASDAAAGASDDPTGASPPGGDTAATEPMTDDNDGPEERGEQVAELQERVTELTARLSDKDERIAELEAQVEEYENERDEVAQAYAGALVDAGETILDADDLAERFEIAELRERLVEATDADDASAALAETEPAIQSGGGSETPADTDETDDRAAELRARADQWESVNPGTAERLRAKADELEG